MENHSGEGDAVKVGDTQHPRRCAGWAQPAPRMLGEGGTHCLQHCEWWAPTAPGTPSLLLLPTSQLQPEVTGSVG